jgi:hypothetical protein
MSRIAARLAKEKAWDQVGVRSEALLGNQAVLTLHIRPIA